MRRCYTRRRLGLAFALALLWPRAALSCQCGEDLSIADAAAAAQLVFAGRVIETWPVAIRVGGLASIGMQATFAVDSRWQGDVGEQVVLLHTGSTCDYHFRRGESYLVFARRGPSSGEDWSSSICSGTRPLLNVSRADYGALGDSQGVAGTEDYTPESLFHLAARRVTLAALMARGTAAFGWRAMEDSPGGAWTRLAIWLLVIGIAVLIAVLVWRRRWRSAIALVAGTLLLSIISALSWGYHLAISNPYLSRFAE